MTLAALARGGTASGIVAAECGAREFPKADAPLYVFREKLYTRTKFIFYKLTEREDNA
jgi:hypothetical protein